MTRLFRDVDYFITEASNRTQREFELNFVDVIEMFGTNETKLTTECGRTVVITWEDKYFKSYHVIYETAQMEQHAANVNRVINILRDIDVDGETMQFILQKVGMEDQMLRQLMLTANRGAVEYLWDEIVELEKSHD